MQKTLESHGLYGDEARAMIKTWSRTGFAAEGTRVIYVVPPKRTDAILPLTIEPKPDALVRVLVGRHEFLWRSTRRSPRARRRSSPPSRRQ